MPEHRSRPSASAAYRFNRLAARLRALREANVRREDWQSAAEVLERALPLLDLAQGIDDDDDREAA